MQAKDIPDQNFLNAVGRSIEIRGCATRWDVAAVLAGHPEFVGTTEATQDFSELPKKVILAKARKLIRRNLVSGCACGCRGDFSIKEENL